MMRKAAEMLAVVVVLAGVARVACAAELALNRVILSSGGIAYYEHAAEVEGDATLELGIRLDQVDDVLKSIIVFDESGSVASVRLPGREPLAQVFRDLPFDEADLGSMVQLLGALQGVEVEATGTRTVRGRLMSVVAETVVKDGGGETTTRHRVTLMTEGGVQQFILEDAASVRFLDDRIAGDVERALAATARYRVMDRRTVQIALRGNAKRTVRVAYVVGAPLWKSAYRLTLSEGGGAGQLQGWAVLENQSGHDWNDVELTLVSGNPVTFRQALYESYYVDRPQVPVEVMGRVLPRLDPGAMAPFDVAEDAGPENGRAGKEAPTMMQQRPAPAPMPGGMASRSALAAMPARAAAPAEAREAATQVVFKLPRPVSVAAGQSVSLPIVDREIPAERIALFQRGASERHPLAAVRLTNAGDSGLPPGVFTVYERSKDGAVTFVGDARIGVLPKGEERIASFALDQRIRVDEERGEEQVFQRAAVSQGVLRVFSQQRQISTYRLEAAKGVEVPVVIEHPRRAGWGLAAPDPGTVATTPEAYRVPVALGPDGRAEAKVVLERIDSVRYALADLGSDRLLALSRQGEMPEAMRNAFTQAARLKSKHEALRRALDELEGERHTIFEDQARIRENLNAAPEGSDIQGRYLRKLAEQEDRLEAIGQRVAEVRQNLVAAQEELASFIAGLNF